MGRFVVLLVAAMAVHGAARGADPAPTPDPRIAVAAGAVHPATQSESAVVLPCIPKPDFDSCISVASFVRVSAKDLFDAYFLDTERLTRFLPLLEFRVLTPGPFGKGSVYEVRRQGKQAWESFRIIALEPPTLIAGAQVEGRFTRWQYHHYVIPVPGGCVSQHLIEFVHPGTRAESEEYRVNYLNQLVVADTMLKLRAEDELPRVVSP